MAAESESVAVAIPRAREAPARAVDDPIAKLNQICKAIALGVAITAGATALYFQFYKARFNGLTGPTIMDQAQVAMHIERGEGMATGVVIPLGLQYAPAVHRHPDLMNSPLYPHLLAAAFRLRRVSNGTVAICSGLVYLATIWALYSLGKALYGKSVAILTAVLYATSVEALDRAFGRGSVSLAGLLLVLGLLALFLVLRREWGGADSTTVAGGRAGLAKWLGVAAAAVLFALTYLAGHVSLLLLLPMAAMIWFGLRRRKTVAALVFIVLALACLVPWFYYNHARTGTLLPPLQARELMTRTNAYPGYSVYRQVSTDVPDAVSFAIANPGQIALKFVTGLTYLYRTLALSMSIYLFPFFVIGAFWPKGSREARALWRAVIAIGLIQIAAACLGTMKVDAALVLVPVATCLAAGAFAQLIGSMIPTRGARAWWIVVLIAVAAFPYAVSIALAGKDLPHASYPNLAWMRDAEYPQGYPRQGQKVVPADAVIATNVPWAVAWYTARTALWLPPNEEGLASLQSRGVSADYIYLSRAQERYREELEPDFWLAMLARPDPGQIARLGRAMVLPGGEILIELKKGW